MSCKDDTNEQLNILSIIRLFPSFYTQGKQNFIVLALNIVSPLKKSLTSVIDDELLNYQINSGFKNHLKFCLVRRHEAPA